jgi:UDP-glucose 4-epimerase
MRKIVVTGASGFLGKYVSGRLKSADREVICVGRRESPGVLKIADYNSCPQGDILVHLAEESDRSKAEKLGESYFDEATRTVANLVSRFKGKFIYASSGTVYGDKSQKLFSENDPVYITDIYSKIKIKNEKTVISAGGSVLRIANVYGSGMPSTNVLTDIINQIPLASPITVRDKSPVRDFVAVEDVADLFALVVDNEDSQIYNAGSGIGTSVEALAQIILDIVRQSEREIVSLQAPKAISHNVLNISKCKSMFGWSPSKTLHKHLGNLLQHHGIDL